MISRMSEITLKLLWLKRTPKLNGNVRLMRTAEEALKKPWFELLSVYINNYSPERNP